MPQPRGVTRRYQLFGGKAALMGVNSVTAGDASIVIGGTATDPTVETGTLDVIAALHPPAGNWSNNSHKITSLANGSAAQDAAAYGQTLAGGDGAPLTTQGDLLYENATPAPARLAIGSAGQVLTTSGGLPAWANPQGAWTGIVAAPTGTAATDSASIRTALSAASSAGGGYVIMQNGAYAGDTSQFAIPAHVTLLLQQNTTWTINCTGGSSVDAITLAANSAIVAQGFGSGGGVVGSATVNCRTLISNATHALQEFCYLNGLSVTLTSGGTYAVAGVEMVSCFVNSGIRDCVISCNSANSGVPGVRLAGGASNGMGPLYLENTWILNSGGDGLLITENNPSQGPCQVWLTNVTVEHPAANNHNIHLVGFGGLTGVKMSGIHTENGNTSSATVACIKIDGAWSVSIRDFLALASNITDKVVVWITSSGNNGFVKIQNLYNNNNISPAIQDDTNSTTVGGGGNVYEYNGPGTTGVIQGLTKFNDTLTVSATDTSGSGALQVANTQSSAFVAGASFLAPNLTAAQQLFVLMGKAASTNDSADFYFNWAGSGSTSNTFGVGFFGNSNGFQVTAAGKFTTVSNTLDDGSGNATFAGDVKLAAGTTSLAPLTFQSGTNLTSPTAGAAEYDGVSAYFTNETTSGRGRIPVEQTFRLTATGSPISTIGNYFGTTSNISLVANAEYEIEVVCWFLKTTAGTVTWTFTNSAAPTSMTIDYQLSPATGIVTTAAATDLFGQQYNVTATAPTVVSASLTSAVNHRHKFAIRLINGTGTSLKIQATASAGSITPGINSYWKARRVPLANVGTFAA